jgi:hypothetical protein
MKCNNCNCEAAVYCYKLEQIHIRSLPMPAGTSRIWQDTSPPLCIKCMETYVMLKRMEGESLCKNCYEVHFSW